MAFLKTAVLLGALCRVTRGDETTAGDVDTSGFYHVPADFGKGQLDVNDYFSRLLAKNQDVFDVDAFGRSVDGARSTFYSEEASTPEPFGPEDSWSILWYFASFSGLIVFFLVVSCSEWCCRKHIRRNNGAQASAPTPPPPSSSTQMETPPPAYDLFAPPSYESLTTTTTSGGRKEKSEYDVYVVPVHALGSVLGAGAASDAVEDAPPSYSAINMNFIPDQNNQNVTNA